MLSAARAAVEGLRGPRPTARRRAFRASTRRRRPAQAARPTTRRCRTAEAVVAAAPSPDAFGTAGRRCARFVRVRLERRGRSARAVRPTRTTIEPPAASATQRVAPKPSASDALASEASNPTRFACAWHPDRRTRRAGAYTVYIQSNTTLRSGGGASNPTLRAPPPSPRERGSRSCAARAPCRRPAGRRRASLRRAA